MSAPPAAVTVRQTTPGDFDGIIALCRVVYPGAPPWTREQLASHHTVFPEGQFVATLDGEVVGMAASLVVLWDDYDMTTNWRDFTDGGTFRNHDPERGRTLYGAEVMVHPDHRGQGIGRGLYDARRALAERRGLQRIRAGARLRGYQEYAPGMSATDYVARVISGDVRDPTLSFQLNQGFKVIGVAPGYLGHDPESLGYAAVIEWLNPAYGTSQPRASS